MQLGCPFPFPPAPRANVLALLCTTRCSQPGERGWASLRETENTSGASRFLCDIGNATLFKFSHLDIGNLCDQGKTDCISLNIFGLWVKLADDLAVTSNAL